MSFIATHAERTTVDGLRWGVEPICRVLTEHGIPIAPSTYDDAIKTARRVTEADLHEERLMLAIARVHHANYGVYGARKVWLALNREGIPVARCTVERLMNVLGLHGARRGRTVRTTRPDVRRRDRRTWSSATSTRVSRMRCGSLTSSATRRC